jgi:hypothetical protein
MLTIINENWFFIVCFAFQTALTAAAASGRIWPYKR